MSAKKREGRHRDFATVVYLDSAPENWRQILDDLHVPAFISPYHDRDLNEDGTPKKPHYHVMLTFESPKTNDQAIEIFSQIGGVGLEIVKTRRGMARYLCHLDNPDKHQYSPDDVTCLGGVDYIETISTVADKYFTLNEVICYIKDSGADNIIDVYDYALSQGFSDWMRIIMDKSFVITSFCNANVYKRKRVDACMNADSLRKLHKDFNKESEENVAT